MSPTLFPPPSYHYHDILLLLSIPWCQHENRSSIRHYHVDAQMFQPRSVLGSANIIENSAPKVGIARTSNCKSLVGNGCLKCNINRKQEGISIAWAKDCLPRWPPNVNNILWCISDSFACSRTFSHTMRWTPLIAEDCLPLWIIHGEILESHRTSTAPPFACLDVWKCWLASSTVASFFSHVNVNNSIFPNVESVYKFNATLTISNCAPEPAQPTKDGASYRKYQFQKFTLYKKYPFQICGASFSHVKHHLIQGIL